MSTSQARPPARPLRKVLATWHATEQEIASIRDAVGDGVEVATPHSEAGLSRYECSLEAVAGQLEDADAIVGWVLPRGALARMRTLQLVCWLHAGVDELDRAELMRRGVRVCNVRGANAPAVAEHAVALLLAAAKRVPLKHQAVREGRRVALWEPGSQAYMLAGRTVTIVGLGSVGSAIAQRLSGFDMRVIGIRRDPSKGGRHVDVVHGPERLREALGESDYIVLSLPITETSERMLGADELAAVKPGALLVNIARGNIVEEAALRDALDAGTLGGYACDVWWNYTDSFPATYHFPTPSRTGLHMRDSVVASGDQANNAEDVRERDIEFGVRSLRQFQEGLELTLEVDLERGY
ncbi:MAG TPA: NAD(P)-dependent oxidoreductase [Solirubrobacteraceae bacterium]